jgi:hypothetical protein
MAMSNINNGGPAFPESTSAEGPYGGMSLRDWFAGQALTGIVTLAGNLGTRGAETLAEAAARQAYAAADAMLAKRSQTEGR